MPATLPVPSKGALRHLRNLALGTSCTIAFSAGLLTEDRRRRIQAAREVHSNAQKIKSSRQYHSTGTTTLESFEEQALRYGGDAFWLPSNVARSKSFVPNLLAGIEPPRKTTPSSSSTPSAMARARPDQPHSIGTTWRNFGIKPYTLSRISSQPLAPKAPRHKIHNRQHKLAVDVVRLLGAGGEPPDLNAAASRFFDAFEEGIQVEDTGLLPALVDAAVKLSRTAFNQSKFEIPEMVLLIISRHGPIDEAQFHRFDPTAVISRLIKSPAQMISGKPIVDEIQLKVAASIYLTTFRTRTMTVASEQMQYVGQTLCARTCGARMYDLTLEICARLERLRGDGPPRAIDYLISATHAKGQHAKLFRYFKKFYTQTSPDQLEFFNIGNLVIDSVLVQRNDIEKAEKVLVEAAQMAQNEGLKMSTTWFLKVLGQEWRTNQDIVRTRAMFERMVSYICLTRHPQAVYGAIIQFCIEAGQESAAMAYYDKLAESYEAVSSDVRISGHFAFAKALRNDWVGVEDDLLRIGRSSQKNPEVYGAIFTPILKAFMQSHPVNETEEFVRTFIEECHLRITTEMFNMMVAAYCKSREIDSMMRWIDYATSVGCRVDAVTINLILTNCSRTWKCTFEDTFLLYRKIRKLNSGLATKYTNSHTISILRGLAVSSAKDDEGARRNLRLLKKSEAVPLRLDSREIYRRMLQSYTKHRLVDVLRTYKRAQADCISLEEKHLVVAVRASLQLHGANLDEPASLIRNAQKNLHGIGAPVAIVIVHQMELLYEGGADASQVSNMARDAIISLERRGIEISPIVETHALSMLVRHGRYQSAIELWESTSRHFKRPSASLDLPTLTVLLKAYIGLQDPRGVKWAMRMLSANNLIPDRNFRLLLKETRKELRKLAQKQPTASKVHGFLDAIKTASQQVKKMRAVLEKGKVDVKFKTIKIIEKAMEDQAAREGATLGVEKMDVEGGATCNSTRSGYSAEPAARWTESEEPRYEFSLPPQRLVGVSA